MTKKGIVTGALILTLASIITRILGFSYRIYMSNAIGAEGMGLYQLIMPIYSLAWSISCSGFTTTVSKLVAQENARKQYGNMGRILKQSLVITTSVAVALTVLLFIFTDFVALNFFKDVRIALPLKLLSLCFPFMAAGSCIRGYFFGLQESKIPAVSQVLEQCIRMAVIFMLAGTFIPLGLEYACCAAIIGIFVGEVLSFLFVFVAYKFFKNKNSLTSKPTLSPMQSLTLIFTMALPLTANRVTGSLLTTFEDILIPQRLQILGATTSEAMSIFGQITGMAMPLIYFPSALLTSLSIALVPAISEATAMDRTKRIAHTTSKAISFTTVIGMGAAALFVVFHKELGLIIYNQDMGQMLLLLGLMCPLLYLQIIMTGILNGLSYQVFIFKNSLLSSVINLIFIYFFIPIYGISAFIAGWFVSLLVTCTLSLIKVKANTHIKLQFSKWFVKPFISALAAGLVMNLVANKIIFYNFESLYALFLSCILLGLSYFIFTVLTGCITIEDIKMLVNGVIPKGKRLERDTYSD